MKKPQYSPVFASYTKALARFEKSISSGQFARYTREKKWMIWNRLCRYARQLGIRVKAPAAAAFIAAGLTFTTPATAQTYVAQQGVLNPLDGVNTTYLSNADFVDIDKDGDKDAFVGGDNGTVRYFQNTGTAVAAVYTEQTGALNPLNGVDVGWYSFPKFADIDNDGDQDVFIGSNYNSLRYFKNTGTATLPVFIEQTGTANPIGNIVNSNIIRPDIVDIDGDGDLDIFFGENGYNIYGNNLNQDGIRYYKNTGTPSSPAFTEQTGAANPLSGFTNGYYNRLDPVFADIDRDGDQDVVILGNGGQVRYFKNTGTVSAPVFEEQEDNNNPFVDFRDQFRWPAVKLVDIDNDTDLDVFIGELYGNITYYKNTAALLPLHLLSFSGSSQAGHNLLTWKTADEVNTRSFEIERSIDGGKYSRIMTVNASGNGNHSYIARDYALYNGKVFYRLKMMDIDNSFTYSQVISLTASQSGSATISLYPNPVTEMININTGNTQLLNTKAGLYDIKGRLLQNIILKNSPQQVNVQALAKGIYVIKFADGTAQHFIKE